MYEYPTCYLPEPAHKHILDKCLTVSREVLKFPILVVPNAYLTEKENQRINDNTPIYLTTELANYFYSLDENLNDEIRLNRFVAKIIIQLITPIEDNITENNIEILKGYITQEEYSNWWNILRNGDMESFSSFVKTCFDKKLPWSYVKDTVEKYYDSNQYCYCINYVELMDLFPCEVLSDKDELEIICETVLKENPKSVEDYHKGKKNSINHLKGQIMKLTKGKANSSVVNIILERKLNV